MLLSAKKEYIFSPFPGLENAHASTVLPLDNGDVLAAWFGGKREGDDSVEIWLSRRTADGWSAPVVVSEKDDVPHWNPVLHQRLDGTIILYYKYGKEIPFWQTRYVESPDGGVTWSAPKELVPGDDSGGRGPVKNKCLRLDDGTLLAPASTEQHRRFMAFIDVSHDDGYTWQRCELMERPRYKGAYVGLIQPTLWQSDEGVHCLMRSSKGALYRSDSFDGGRTWQKPRRTRMPNNNSGVDCDRDEKGRLWLVCNPVAENWGVRHPLTLFVSLDNGKHFTEIMKLEAGNGEFSYPAIVCKGNKLYITYTYLRKKIVCWEIETT